MKEPNEQKGMTGIKVAIHTALISPSAINTRNHKHLTGFLLADGIRAIVGDMFD